LQPVVVLKDVAHRVKHAVFVGFIVSVKGALHVGHNLVRVSQFIHDRTSVSIRSTSRQSRRQTAAAFCFRNSASAAL
jgi:hypothetical protein